MHGRPVSSFFRKSSAPIPRDDAPNARREFTTLQNRRGHAQLYGRAMLTALFRRLIPLLLLAHTPAALAEAAKNCGCGCCKDRPKEAACCCYAAPVKVAAAKSDAKRHPLRGVVTAVHVDRSALMVKHEEIPGVMRAMTMLFKVDAAVLKTVQKGQTITAQMSRQGDDWWLHDVKVVAPKSS
jgi:Cu/Ag efflux protein CusF